MPYLRFAIEQLTLRNQCTDSFVQALRRFIARCGPARSDNGTNFVGVANELRKAVDKMIHEEVKHYLQNNGK